MARAASANKEIVLKPAEEVNTDKYIYNINRAPVLTGWALSAFIYAFESSWGSTIYGAIGPSSGVVQVRM
jgi:hypothetical protein